MSEAWAGGPWLLADESAGRLHAGELAVQARAGAPRRVQAFAARAIAAELTTEQARHFAGLTQVALGARDRAGRPWATWLAGAPGFVWSDEPARLEIDAAFAPGDALSAPAVGADLAVLGVEFRTRRRVRVNGWVEASAPGRLRLAITQAFGNCPQYVTPRALRPALLVGEGVEAARASSELSDEDSALLSRADTAFLATGAGNSRRAASEGLDVSHRGGPAGFVALRDARTLELPDYAGNNLYSTLGNLQLDPRAGLSVLDFVGGQLLQLTGSARVDWSPAAAARHAGARRVVRFAVEHAVRRALPVCEEG